jgi:hypothetical protein
MECWPFRGQPGCAWGHRSLHLLEMALVQSQNQSGGRCKIRCKVSGLQLRMLIVLFISCMDFAASHLVHLHAALTCL